MKRLEIILGICLITLSFGNIFSQENQPSKEELALMNQVDIPAFKDTVSNNKGDELKVLIVGNSLTYHGKSKDIGWNFNHGMAASSKKNDFAHLIYKNVENIFPNKKVKLRITNLYLFEIEYDTYDFRAIDSLTSFNANIIIFQLGENVSFSKVKTIELFENRFINLINHFKSEKNPIIICTTPFFPSLVKNNVIERVAITTNSFIVDLSHLTLLDSENYARDEINYPSDKTIWKVEGIGGHPGDLGMKNIAQQISITISAAVKMKQDFDALLDHKKIKK